MNRRDPSGLVWVTTGYDYHGTANWLKWYLNRWAIQIGNNFEINMPGSNPDEYVGISRDVIQEWRHDPNNPCRDKEHYLGTRRRVPQKYMRFLNPGPSEVLINDPEAHTYNQWDPWVGSPTYNDYPNTKYDGILYWQQGR